MGKFNVLWIDDQPQKCKKEQMIVKKAIIENGLQPEIKFITKVKREELLTEGHESNNALVSRDYDLLIIDYKLSGDLLGGDVISEVRIKYNIYTDIIFYSSIKKDFINSVKKSFDEPSALSYMDNVNIVPLGDEFQIKVQHVVRKIVESWYNAHSIRGVILSQASKFEVMVNQIIEKYYKSELNLLKEKLNKKGKNINKTVNDKWNFINRLEDPIPIILGDPINFNWSVRKALFETILESGLIEKNEKLVKGLYNLFSLRNDFAHNVVKIENGVCCLYKEGKQIKYDTKTIRGIRDEISEINEYLNKFL